jgi:hypothetical protein
MLNPIDVRYFKLAVGESRIKHIGSDDITVRCPICGDSQKSKNKARMHLYRRGDKALVNCFNECSCVNKSMYRFLKDYYPNLLDAYKQETFGERIKQAKSLDFSGFSSFDIKTEIQEGPKVLFDLSQYFKKSSSVFDYIEKRGLEWHPNLGDVFLGSKITIDGKFYNVDNYIIIPLMFNDKWYGFYSRSLTEHKFQTFIPEANNGWKLWNYFNIDKSKPVYVFEGIFDALSAYNSGITNVVACLGATPPNERLEGLDVVFCLDNDRTGYLNSIKYLKMGYKALCYPDSIKEKDMNDILNSGVNVKDLILNNIVSGILGEIKIKSKL